jgi:hypothetical protein
MIGPGTCRDCPHRVYCADVAECRPMVLWSPPDPRMATTATRCPTCRRVSYTPGRPGWCGWCHHGADE